MQFMCPMLHLQGVKRGDKMRRSTLLVLLLVALSSAARHDFSLLDLIDSDDTEEPAKKWHRTSHSYVHDGYQLVYQNFRGYRVVEPTVAMKIPKHVDVHHYGTAKYRVSFPLHMKANFELPKTGDKWANMEVTSVKCSLAHNSACGSLCRGVTTTVTKVIGHYMMHFICAEKITCRRIAKDFVSYDPRSDKLFGFIVFTIRGLVHHHQLDFRWSSGQTAVSSEFFMFEEGKALLYTIKKNIGKEVYTTYKSKGNNHIPSDGSLPNLYRSEKLDTLSSALGRSGYKRIVAEMRAGGKVVSQAVFDVSTNSETTNMMNWFTRSRLVSSFPYHIGTTGFNFFSIPGDRGLKRTFYVNHLYGGCLLDKGFWCVSDHRDMCPWSNIGWKGSAPVLVYTQVPGIPYQKGNAFYADRFLVYLANEVGKPSPVPYPFYRFEHDKVLLYAIKSNVGQNAYDTYMKKGTAEIPSDGPLPNLYRSKLLDTLPFAIVRSGHGKIVAEMRTGNNVVAQVVFDVSTNKKAVTKDNWFTAARMVTSFPYKLKKTGFNFFSVIGDLGLKRSFFINHLYGGCTHDKGFWAVSNGKDICPWSNSGWRGSPPVLVYTEVPNKKYSEGNAFYADRFIVYLTTKMPRPHPIKKPVFRFEHNKVLLYTIKKNIGQTAYKTFTARGNNEIPADSALPDLYRSNDLDSMAETIDRQDYKLIVAEMRSDEDKVVAQVVFDVSKKRSKITMTNWFTPARMVKSYPYKIDKTGYNFFTIAGDKGLKRTFFISNVYGGCPHDKGFWCVSDHKDICPWSNKGWKGSAPVLVYTKVPRIKYSESNAFYADRFLIYFTNEMPRPPSIKVRFFEFEDDKALLYTIKSSIGKTALKTYKTRGNNKIPSDNSLPDVYRSDHLDTLAYAIEKSDYKHIVAEMRTDGKTVARVVFDASSRTRTLNKMNWFKRERVVSSYPYKLRNSGFNFFTIPGDIGLKRTFFINYVYGGCLHDIGFWAVSDGRDICPWSNRAWTGAAPVLVYTRVPGKKYQDGNAFYADRFLVYLANDLPKPGPVSIPFFKFEEGKALLFSIKSNIGKEAFQAYKTRGNSAVPSDGSLPNIYRSDQLDSLSYSISRSGYKKIVAEMRADGKAVAQVVFDVSKNTESVGMTNWFSPARMVSSKPYELSKTGFNFFSIAGDRGLKRSFFINHVYGGCLNDIGFWCVSEHKDICPWSNKGWRGSAPVLVYTHRPRTKYNKRNAFYADRFLIYLM